ncbi:DUF4293 domain-containing protein [Halosquirtibacter xylanolyticus]|uniref:DUF4293 domain-containing protein n=1 Tax=Halosquirtibacter xylanolyticus TaxID=3374599 RepID=UPI0037494885|nr:DUF4293 domain-containing protein [Prolixibacteraceae bacterium]
MIQRIQSLFLLLSAIMMTSLFVPTLVWIKTKSETFAMGLTKFTPALPLTDADNVSLIPLVIFVGLIIILSLITIFMYRNRIMQMRITVVNLILKLGVVGVAYFYASTTASLIHGDVKLNYVLVFPVIALIFDYLAIRSIGKDEALVRATDRIR